MTLNDKSIIFGISNSIGHRRYVMVQAAVYLINDLHYPFISQGLEGLVDERLLPSPLKLSSLKFADFTLQQVPQGWHASNSDDQTAKALIDHWQRIEAARISRYQARTTPQQKITASLQDGAQIDFYVLSIKPEIVIARPDLKLAYHFPATDYYRLLAPAKSGE